MKYITLFDSYEIILLLSIQSLFLLNADFFGTPTAAYLWINV